jgi:DNA helicase-2/ATP-dependent DNA helicase PcrA
MKLIIDEELNKEQAAAVRQIDGPLLIIAGAGSGKTRVITYRIAYMLERGIPQSNILALTFTNKAAREMATRVRERTGRKLQNLTTSTFHSFGASILREEIEALGYRPNFSIYDESDKTQAVTDALKTCKVENANPRDVGGLFSRLKCGMVEWGAGASVAWLPVFEEYQRALKVYNACDFDDLLLLPIKLFDEHPDVLARYRERYKYIMVDEFQDTSSVQYRLLRMLACRNICVVGDDDQSIYSWRGANYENIVAFEHDFPDVVEIKLEQNYRSTNTILEAANNVIANNSNRKPKRLWAAGSQGDRIQLWTAQNETAEADFIAERIQSIAIKEHLKYDDFGVLLRTNSLTEPIEESLLAADIPYHVSGGTSFFARKEVKDILSYLRVIGNPNDDVNLLRIINTPRRGIGQAAIAFIMEEATKNGSSLWEALKTIRSDETVGELFPSDAGGGADDDIGGFISLIEHWREKILGKRGLSRNVRTLVDEIDYRGYLMREFGKKSEKAARWKVLNVERLLQSIADWESNADNFDPTLYPYLNRVSLITRDEADDNDKGKVNLMTIHAAKGLEFSVVFIAGAEDGIMPHERSIEDDAADSDDDGVVIAHSGGGGLEEERRLFYVAVTRARARLFITNCRERRRNHALTFRAPSPFIAEIPQNLTETFNPATKANLMTTDEFIAAMEARHSNT